MITGKTDMGKAMAESAGINQDGSPVTVEQCLATCIAQMAAIKGNGNLEERLGNLQLDLERITTTARHEFVSHSNDCCEQLNGLQDAVTGLVNCMGNLVTEIIVIRTMVKGLLHGDGETLSSQASSGDVGV